MLAGCFIVLAAVSIQCYFHRRLPHWLPRSFTVGEAAIIAQGAASFLLYAFHLYLTAVSIQSHFLMKDVNIALSLLYQISSSDS